MSSNEKGPPVGNQEGPGQNKSEPLSTFISNSELLVNIPKELKDLPHWVGWKQKKRDGKSTKPPVSISDGRPAAPNDPASWGSFERARAYSESKRGKGISGIGFVFTDGDPYCGIDIDKCRDPETGKISQLCQKIIKQLNSYTEISPSETGVHIILKGRLPKGRRKNTQLGVEVYNRGRYFTVTGNTLDGFKEIRECQPELDFFWTKYIAQEPGENLTPVVFDQRDGVHTDNDIIQKAMNAKNGEKFQQLWEGNWKGADYGSQSEADLALCAILAFYVGRDPERIDAFFRRSGLYREKWERADYRDGTIQKSLERQIEYFHENQDSMVCENEGSEKEDVNYRFPSEIMAGVAGDFADLYSSYLEVPEVFFYMAFLTCLGNILVDRLTLLTEIAPQPRLYTVLLGESADDRKSTGISKTVEFFLETQENFNVCYGVGSAEGLQMSLKENNNLLLCLDEFKHFVNKSKIPSSVLLPFVNTLFESNRYESRTKTGHIKIEGAKLSLLAASTIQTYENTWDSAFTDIGFNNRLFLVPGTGQRKFPIPHKIPESEKSIINAKLHTAITKSIEEPKLNISEDARDLYDDWYFNIKPSIHSKRLDTYALRLMPLLAINELKAEVDLEVMLKVITLVNWQLQVRKIHDPVDADNTIATMEEKIRRKLSMGPLSDRDLKRNTNAHRSGLWCYNMAIKNLSESKEIKKNSKTGKWTILD